MNPVAIHAIPDPAARVIVGVELTAAEAAQYSRACREQGCDPDIGLGSFVAAVIEANRKRLRVTIGFEPLS